MSSIVFLLYFSEANVISWGFILACFLLTNRGTSHILLAHIPLLYNGDFFFRSLVLFYSFSLLLLARLLASWLAHLLACWSAGLLRLYFTTNQPHKPPRKTHIFTTFRGLCGRVTTHIWFTINTTTFTTNHIPLNHTFFYHIFAVNRTRGICGLPHISLYVTLIAFMTSPCDTCRDVTKMMTSPYIH
jgi:hypothetical protein